MSEPLTFTIGHHLPSTEAPLNLGKRRSAGLLGLSRSDRGGPDRCRGVDCRAQWRW